MENDREKTSIEDSEFANVAGGVPGELICRTASSVVSMLFSMSNAEHTSNALSDSFTGDDKAGRSKK